VGLPPAPKGALQGLGGLFVYGFLYHGTCWAEFIYFAPSPESIIPALVVAGVVLLHRLRSPSLKPYLATCRYLIGCLLHLEFCQ
jgi:hypothetical protein